MRRPAPLVVAILACLLTASGCSGPVTVRTANASPLTPESSASSPKAGARVASGFRVASPKLKPVSSPSAAAPGRSGPVAPGGSGPVAPPAAPSAGPAAPAAAPIPATGRGPGGSLTNTGSDAVALTFDDGPDPKYTPELLDLLKAQGVKATFCVVGSRVRAYPDVVRRIVADGHTLCNHSWRHLDLSKHDAGYVARDLQSTNDAIHAAAPDARIEYFRAPYGNFTPGMVQIAARMGMKPIYWSVDDQCWLTAKYGTGTAMVDHITTIVRRDIRPGGIILSHDIGKPQTIVAYRSLLPWLKAHFRMEALPTSVPAHPKPEPR